MKPPQKREYGDFQTPLNLAIAICQKIERLGVAPNVIFEPTCGLGAFVEAAAQQFPKAKRIIGLEINPFYLAELENKKRYFPNQSHISLKQGDFFNFDWQEITSENDGSLLVVGNFPWVTNSALSRMGSSNLPVKSNFQLRTGFEALTGKSNFDISEWMLIETAGRLQSHQSYLAILCKTTVARKFLNYLYTQQIGLRRAMLYTIDTKRYIGVSVEACLLFCHLDPQTHHYDYEIYQNLNSSTCQQIGYRYGMSVKETTIFDQVSHFYDPNGLKWRSGVKHDCAEVMELRELNGSYINGLGEVIELESDYLFPLLKGSDIANHRLNKTNRYLIVTQKEVGEPTEKIKVTAPKTWSYLESHAHYLDLRKSKVYSNQPRYAMFGVGNYAFAPYKIAICGLYKKLAFQLVGPIEGKPVMLDDTTYFLSFMDAARAKETLQLLESSIAQTFYSSLIFWDEKRPIKSAILNCLNLSALNKQVSNGAI